MKRPGDFQPGDGHFCQVSLGDYDRPAGKCRLCGQDMTRLKHAPGHTVNGKVCTWPASWRFCHYPTVDVEAALHHPLILPDFEVAPR